MKNLLKITTTITFVIVAYIAISIIDAQPGQFKVGFLDVGQGDAIFIQTPDKFQILIDTGSSSVITSELGGVMAPWDRSIDMVIITHPDADHFGAIDDVTNAYRVDTIIDNGFYHDEDFLEYKNQIESEFVKHVNPKDGYSLELPGEVLLTFISVPTFGQGSDKNDESIIVRVDYQDASFLFTGDASVDIEEQLIEDYPGLLDVDVLKLGHHGSKTSTSDRFLEATTPQIAVVSASAGNRYGHPHPEVMERVEQRDIISLCTCDVGRIVFRWKEGKLLVKK